MLSLACFAALFLAAFEDKGVLVGLDGFSSKTPAEWKEIPTTNQFQYKVFELPAAEGEKEKGQVIVSAPGIGGGVKANVDRWVGQFKGAKEPKTEEFKVAGEKVKVTYVDIAGTYLQRAQPFNPNSKVEEKENYRLIGVVFEGPKETYFIRCFGPAKAVEAGKKGFDEWLKNFK